MRTGLEPKSVANPHPAQTGFSSRRGSPTGVGNAPKKDAGIVILLSLTLIKAVAQLVKNDFTQALGQQGLEE